MRSSLEPFVTVSLSNHMFLTLCRLYLVINKFKLLAKLIGEGMVLLIHGKRVAHGAPELDN